MSHKIRLTPYGEALDEREFDADAGGADFRDDGSPSSMTIGHYAAPDNRMPIFLDNEDEAFLDGEDEPPIRRGFGSGGDIQYRPSLWPRILKAGMFTAAAAGIALAISSMDNPMGLFTNAKASLPGAAADPSSAAPSIAPPAPAIQQAAPVQVPPPAASAKLTREEIAAALRASQQVQPEKVQPEIPQPKVASIPQPKAAEIPQPRAAAPPTMRLAADELVNLMRRARALIEVGDISPARLLLERAAEAQEASAALLLAQTYDPAVIGTQDLRSITADPAMAKAWYQKAAELGSPEARGRLAQIQN